MTWPRPVPLVGDPTTAAQRSADPRGWAFEPPVVDALHTVIEARRDVRRFRPDPVPDALLRRVLDAGHRAPSVGHSQPWRFVVVTESATRAHAAGLADRERLRQAELLEPERRARLLDLQLEGLREAPLGIVIACDRRAHHSGVLGRATFPDSDLWSCACAVQNIWLAARAVGLGVGWVTLFPPAELADLLHLPDGVETLGWLCVGWPDERPPLPGLERHGWSRRLSLDDVVIAERWPHRHEPPPPPSHLPAPTGQAVVAARDAGDDLLTPPGSLGVLDRAVERVLSVHRRPPASATLVLAVADHPVADLGVSAYGRHVGADLLAAATAGQSIGVSTARASGLQWQIVPCAARHVQGNLLDGDGLDERDVRQLLDAGRDIGAALAGDGIVCVGEIGIGNTTVAAALDCLLRGAAPEHVVGLGSGADAGILTRKSEVVAAVVARASSRGIGPGDPEALLALAGGPEIALLTGVVLGAAASSAAVVLDGYATCVAALLATRHDPAVQSCLIAGQRSRERAHAAVLTELGLEPLLQLRLRAGEGVGAVLATQLVLTALRARASTGRTR